MDSYICMYICLFSSLHFWRVTHRTHKLELLYTREKKRDKYTLIIQVDIHNTHHMYNILNYKNKINFILACIYHDGLFYNRQH